MKDKEMIEEMAIIDCCRVPKGTNCADCQFARVDMCNSYRMATKLYEQGYRKLPEDSVVLSREEYDKLKYTWITDSDAYKKGSKETAEKIYNFVERYIMDDAEVELMVKEWFKKQYGVEIKE